MNHSDPKSFFAKKQCVVTGANRGIGLALTQSLLSYGAQVLAGCRSPDEASELQALKAQYKDHLQVEQLDIRQDESVTQFAKQVPSRVDVLFNNAGINLSRDGDPLSVPPDVMMETFDVNTVGPLRVTKALLPALHQSKEARVANISSIMGSITENGVGGHTAYRVSKTALNMVNKNLSLHDKNVIFLTLHPGWVQTDMGGKSVAPVKPHDSAEGLLRVVASATAKSSGMFIRFDGEVPGW